MIYPLSIAFHCYVDSIFNSLQCLQLKQSLDNTKQIAKVKKKTYQINGIPLPLTYIHLKCLSQTTYNKYWFIYMTYTIKF